MKKEEIENSPIIMLIMGLIIIMALIIMRIYSAFSELEDCKKNLASQKHAGYNQLLEHNKILVNMANSYETVFFKNPRPIFLSLLKFNEDKTKFSFIDIITAGQYEISSRMRNSLRNEYNVLCNLNDLTKDHDRIPLECLDPKMPIRRNGLESVHGLRLSKDYLIVLGCYNHHCLNEKNTVFNNIKNNYY